MPTRKDAAGRWHVEVCIDRRRVHRRLPEGASAGDAKRLEAELVKAMSSDRRVRQPQVPGDPLLVDIMGAYTEEHAQHLRSPATARHHALRIAPWLTGKRASDAREVAAKIKADMAGAYAPATINRSLGTLKKALSLAWERRQTAQNWGAEVKRVPEHNARETYLTLPQVQEIAQHCSRPAQAAIWIAVLGGLRRGEILGLQPGDVQGDRLLIRAGNTKTLRTRSIPIVTPMRPWLAHLPLEITAEGVKSAWRRAREKAGRDDVHFHDLRHSCASLLLQVPGVTLHVVAEILGHSQLQTTRRYAHLADDGD